MIFQMSKDEQFVSFTFSRKEFYLALSFIQRIKGVDQASINNLVDVANTIDGAIQEDASKKLKFTLIKGDKPNE